MAGNWGGGVNAMGRLLSDNHQTREAALQYYVDFFPKLLHYEALVANVRCHPCYVVGRAHTYSCKSPLWQIVRTLSAVV